MRVPPLAFFITKYFGSGVIIATAFIHVSSPIILVTIYCPVPGDGAVIVRWISIACVAYRTHPILTYPSYWLLLQAL